MEAAVVDLARLAEVHRAAGEAVECVVDHHVVDDQRQFLARRQLDHRLRVLDTGGDRLLDDDMLAGVERLDRQGCVAGVVGIRHIFFYWF